MENYVYFLREIIDKHKIYQFDKLKDSREDLYDFLERFSKEAEEQYLRKTYKTLRYLIVDQMYYVLRDEEVPKNIEHAVFVVAFHENTYYFMLEKVVPIKEAESIKSNIQLLNSKEPEGVKELYIDALKDLDTELDFTFIDLKKRVENDIYYKSEYLKNQYSKMWIISFYNAG
jgi:hypothetical protein